MSLRAPRGQWGHTPQSTLPSRRPRVLRLAHELRGGWPSGPTRSLRSETSFSWEIKCARGGISCVLEKRSECLLFAFDWKRPAWQGGGVPRASAVSAGSLADGPPGRGRPVADDGFDWHGRTRAPQACVHVVMGFFKWLKGCWPRWLLPGHHLLPPAWLGGPRQRPGSWGGQAGASAAVSHPRVAELRPVPLARKDVGVRLPPTIPAPGTEAGPRPSRPHWSVGGRGSGVWVHGGDSRLGKGRGRASPAPTVVTAWPVASR